MEILFDVTQDTWPTGGEQDGDLKPQSREQGIQGLSWLALTDGRSESFERSTEDQLINQDCHEITQFDGAIIDQYSATCSWLLLSLEYQNWRNSNGSSVLWIHGLPGSGKSVLSDVVLEDLQQTASLAVKCSVPSGSEYPEALLLKSVIEALQEQRPIGTYGTQLQRSLASVEHRAAHIPPRQFQIHLRLIFEAYAVNDHVFLVFDGLDDWTWTKTRILDVLSDTAFKLQTSIKLSCMICSRAAWSAPVSQSVTEIDLDTSQAVCNEVGILITKTMNQLSLKYPERRAELAEIDLHLKKNAGSNFLWTSLILTEIARVFSLSENYICISINDLPSKLTGLYRRIIQAVTFHHVCTSQEVKQIFTWAIYATRPLTTSELIEAFSTKAPTVIPASGFFSESNGRELLRKERLHTISGGLLTIGNEDTLQFIHRTAQEFCRDESRESIPLDHEIDVLHAHEYLAQVCLQYLLDHDKVQFLLSEVNEQTASTELSKKGSSFLDYAVRSWSKHYRIAEAHSMYLPGMLQHCLMRIHWAIRPDSKIYESKISQIFALCAQLGFAKLGQTCLDMGVEIDGISHQRQETPFQTAVANGHLSLVVLLIFKGANVNDFSGGLTPLHLAACKGQREVCRLLLSSGVDKDAKSKEGGESPLHIAVGEQFDDVVQILLAAGADRNMPTGVTYETALHIAAELDDVEMCKLLLVDNLEIDHGDSETWNQLLQQHLVHRGSELAPRIGGAIPNRGMNEEFSNDFRWRWCQGTIEYLNRTQNPLLRGNCFEKHPAYLDKTPNFLKDSIPITERRVEMAFAKPCVNTTIGQQYRINLSAKNRDGWTALHVAAASGHGRVCELLLSYGGNPYEQTSSGETALQLAENHYGRLAERCSEREVSDPYAQNVYHAAIVKRISSYDSFSEEDLELEEDWIVIEEVTQYTG
ncbi:MAG: hypothetical protein MMC33_006020 [Icmadophila ericetorum]|nr:hypothetical protein [Icmadophila ericetorum]